MDVIRRKLLGRGNFAGKNTSSQKIFRSSQEKFGTFRESFCSSDTKIQAFAGNFSDLSER